MGPSDVNSVLFAMNFSLKIISSLVRWLIFHSAKYLSNSLLPVSLGNSLKNENMKFCIVTFDICDIALKGMSILL